MRTCTDATKRKIAILAPYNGFAPALTTAIHDAIHGKPMSLERERRMCAALGLDAPPPEYSVPACPGCGGEPHVAREGCHGQPVAAVAVLAPGQTVTRRKPRQYSRIDQMPVSMLARAIRERAEYVVP